MTLDEAQKLILVACAVHGRYDACAEDVLGVLNELFPEFIWEADSDARKEIADRLQVRRRDL